MIQNDNIYGIVDREGELYDFKESPEAVQWSQPIAQPNTAFH